VVCRCRMDERRTWVSDSLVQAVPVKSKTAHDARADAAWPCRRSTRVEHVLILSLGERDTKGCTPKLLRG
jgi:hypothetical protein